MTVKDCYATMATVAVIALVIMAFGGAFTLLDAVIMIGLCAVAGTIMAIGVVLKEHFFG